MKTVRVENGEVRECIPDYALPVKKWYGPAFAAKCMVAPDEVEQGWVLDAHSGAFVHTKIGTHKYTGPERAQQKITDMDLDMIQQGQMITDQELEQIEQGQALSELELTFLEGQACLKKSKSDT